MHRPVLMSPPDILPVGVDEVRANLVSPRLDDEVIETMIGAATNHLDGWTGILGRCLVEQTWKQQFDIHCGTVEVALGPVIDIVSVTDGADEEISPDHYQLTTSPGGRFLVAFDNIPAGPITITYRAGYETVPADGEEPARSGVPQNAKLAIILMVHHMASMLEHDLFQTQESVVGVGTTMRAITPHVGPAVTDAVTSLISNLMVKRL